MQQVFPASTQKMNNDLCCWKSSFLLLVEENTDVSLHKQNVPWKFSNINSGSRSLHPNEKDCEFLRQHIQLQKALEQNYFHVSSWIIDKSNAAKGDQIQIIFCSLLSFSFTCLGEGLILCSIWTKKKRLKWSKNIHGEVKERSTVKLIYSKHDTRNEMYFQIWVRSVNIKNTSFQNNHLSSF